MTKLVVTAVILALMLVAAAVPAFAASAVGGSVQYVDCDQAQVAVTQQVNAANNQDLVLLDAEVLRHTSEVLACSDSIAAGGSVWWW